MDIPGYNIIKNNHPPKTKCGGVCVYYKNTLPSKLVNIKDLQWCISFEIRIEGGEGGECWKFISLYRSPSRPMTNMNPFWKTLNWLLIKFMKKIHLWSVLGDFHTKSNSWHNNDSTSHEGSMIDTVMSNYGLHQLIQEATHILNSSSSCIDPIFTSQPDLVMESGVNSSLLPNCPHLVVFAKI